MIAFDLQAELIRLAQSLRPVGAISISVLKIAYELGTTVWLRLHTTRGSHSAQIDLASCPARIILYRSGDVDGEREIRVWEDDLLTARERFSVAHELGHWVAFSNFKIGPQSDRHKYWDQERAINAFAGCLLAPDWLVASWLQEIPANSPISPFALRHWAASQCRSSEEVVAKALARHRSSIGFLKLQSSKRKDGAPILKVLCSAAGERVSLPKNQSHIENQQFRQLLSSQKVGSANVSQLQLGKCVPQNFNIAWRHMKTSDSEEKVWVSLASTPDPTTIEHSRKTSNPQHYLQYPSSDSD